MPETRCPSSIFIIGAARSGTSLLYKALCVHPQAAYVSNYIERCPAVPSLALLNRVPRRLTRARQRVWFGSDSNAYVYGRRRPLFHRLLPMPVEGESLFRRAGFAESPAGHEADADAQKKRLCRSMRVISLAGSGQMFINKRIANGRRIPQLVRAVPSARFVSIIRDGRAVAYSLSQVNWWDNSTVWWYGSTPAQWRAEGRDPWELCARNWVEEVKQIELAQPAVPSSQFLTVHYEDLVADPVATLELVAEFAGLTHDRGWSNTLRSLRYPDRNERWRAELSSQAISTIEAIQAETLRRYGYQAQ